ncbi:TetR/AcrR family fatty acid metabolism transcriptional regulator [Desulfitispora alkaliphila]|uniref:TetR/AcrR family transcriptional regulator n=1 Tax=Desulfitispora alkaliphila TaxID=622674 RepID=UPI003D1BE9A8
MARIRDEYTKKEQIREAAISVIAKDGFHTASTDKIAAKAGISVGTIYNYFKNKSDILDYIFQVEYEKRAAFFKNLQEQKDTHPTEKITAILNMHFKRVSENPDLIKVVLEEMRFSQSAYFKQYGRKNGFQKFLAEIIQDGIKQGKIRKCNPEIVALTLFGFIEAMMKQYIYQLTEEGSSDVFAHAVEEINALIWQGLVVEGEPND